MWCGRFYQVISFILFIVTSDSAEEEKYLTCRELKTWPSFESGIYKIFLPSGEYNVYCEMAINGGGYTFLPSSIVSKLTREDMKYLSKNQDDVILRISKLDGTQPYTILSPYLENGTFSIQANNHTGAPSPENVHLGPYIFLSTLPSAKPGDTVMVFKSNGRTITYDVCLPGTIPSVNHFAFFPNPNEIKMSDYHRDNPIYEKVGVAVDWRKTAKRPYSGRRIPLDYFMLTEMHYAPCGCYTSSERWLDAASPALGTAIGLR